MTRRAYKGPDRTCSATTGLLGALREEERGPMGPRELQQESQGPKCLDIDGPTNDSRRAPLDPDGPLRAKSGLFGALKD